MSVIVMEVIAQERGGRLIWELLYVHDLILMAESEESLCEKVVKWKYGMEVKGLKMTTKKQKYSLTVVKSVRWKR